MVRDKRRTGVKAKAEAAAEERILDALVGPGSQPATRDSFRKKLRAGELDDKEVELSLADTASPMQGLDLPGGGNVGIVTSFEYRLHDVGPVLGGSVVFPFAKAKDVLAFYDDFARSCPDELSVNAALWTTADGVPVVGIGVAWCGALDLGERVLRPLQTFETPLADTIASMRYVDRQRASDAFFPFRDGLDAAAATGVAVVVQPGGSVRDAEVIAAADEHGIAMLFTGERQFLH